VRVSEWLSIAYGVYVATVAAARPDARARLVACSWGALMIVLPAGIVAYSSMPLVQALRNWAPAVYILASYYGSGALFVAPSARFEAWLLRADSWLLRERRPEALPSWLSVAVEVLYTGTFLMIPLGFAILTAEGFAGAADRYWTTVSAAEYVAFGVLPWLPSRPPWVVDRLDPAHAVGIRRVGLEWVRRTSHHANTFPSGHTAGSLAVALAVWPFVPAAGAVLLAVALGIALGCVSGRYHYAVDVVAGIAVAVVVSLAAAIAAPYI
jgi:membrane-associated phospholipid phosphatase